jgi:hypothetical protein
MQAIATIVFGAALLIEGGTMITEYALMTFPTDTVGTAMHKASVGNFSAVVLGGAAGIVLGILALLGIKAVSLTSIAAIVFGCALLFSSNAARHLHMFRQTAVPAREWRSGTEFLAAELVNGSSGLQALAGLAAIILGILALTLSGNAPVVLTLSALIVVGTAVVLTGSAATEFVWGVMQPDTSRRTTAYGAAE